MTPNALRMLVCSTVCSAMLVSSASVAEAKFWSIELNNLSQYPVSVAISDITNECPAGRDQAWFTLQPGDLAFPSVSGKDDVPPLIKIGARGGPDGFVRANDKSVIKQVSDAIAPQTSVYWDVPTDGSSNGQCSSFIDLSDNTNPPPDLFEYLHLDTQWLAVTNPWECIGTSCLATVSDFNGHLWLNAQCTCLSLFGGGGSQGGSGPSPSPDGSND
jgi:hypothetical protein